MSELFKSGDLFQIIRKSGCWVWKDNSKFDDTLLPFNCLFFFINVAKTDYYKFYCINVNCFAYFSVYTFQQELRSGNYFQKI